MTVNGFIFARGGSKGLPRKNIKKLNGKPLIQYSIETALASSKIDEIFVSTEDDEIASVAQMCGATVIKRPQELAGDKSPEWLSWRHAIEWVEENRGQFDCFVSLPATSPLRSIEDVNLAIAKSSEEGIDICISVTEASRSPYFNIVKFECDSKVSLVCSSENMVERRQDAPKVFDVTTVVYAASPSFIMSNYGVFSGSVAAVTIPKERAVDIDDIYDFYLAEAILKQK